ncbi:MAG TPA: hypothetical protein VLL08_02305 [Kineosporiaceae bacterium]|nr:hypothetical protein [Kineosporiaceae bacterium]
MTALVISVVGTSVGPVTSASAADAGGVSWNPGEVTWELMPDGRCLTTQDVTVKTKNHEDAVSVSAALRGVPAKTDYPAESGILDTHGNVGFPGDTGSEFGVVLHTYLKGEMCQAPGGGGATPAPAPADAAPATQTANQQVLFDAAGRGDLSAAQLAAVPLWLKGAIGAVVGAAVYVGVSAMVTAGITATGVLVGASAATLAAVTAASGCIGGAASTAVTLLLAGSGSSWQSTLANAAAGCLTGAAIGLLPIKTVGEAAGNAIRGVLGFAPAAVVGEAGVAAATSAGVELTGITQVTSVAADALVAVQ